MDIICLVPFRHSVKHKTWISGYTEQVDTHNQVPVLSTSAGLTATTTCAQTCVVITGPDRKTAYNAVRPLPFSDLAQIYFNLTVPIKNYTASIKWSKATIDYLEKMFNLHIIVMHASHLATGNESTQSALQQLRNKVN